MRAPLAPPFPALRSNTGMGQNSMTATTTSPEGRIAFIQAGWHREIVGQARISFIEELDANGVPATRVDIFDVPGSLEIPLQAKLLAQSGSYDIVVGAGFVIDGGIYRHDFVASAVIDGIMRVQLETQVPVLSIVLTPHRYHEHEEHHEFFMAHFKIKGREAARACIATLRNVSAARALVAG